MMRLASSRPLNASYPAGQEKSMGILAGMVKKPHHNQTLCNRFWITYNQPLGYRLLVA